MASLEKLNFHGPKSSISENYFNLFFVSYIYVSAFLKVHEVHKIIYADRKEAHCVVNSIHVECIEETFYPLLGAIHDPSGYGRGRCILYRVFKPR